MNTPNRLAQKPQTFSSYLAQSNIDWRENCLLFASASNTYVGSGIALSIEVDDDDIKGVQRQIRTLLARAKKENLQPIVLGVLAFDGHSRSRFIVPKRLQKIPSGGLKEGLITPHCKSYDLKKMHFSPNPDDYKSSVEAALAKTQVSTLEKVVLARLLELGMKQKIDVPLILDQLMCQSSSNYVFSIPTLPGSAQENTVFLGASPELLVQKQDGNVFANPLSGSIASSLDVQQNALNRALLLQSEKDCREHEFAHRAVAEILHPFCSRINVPAELEALSAGPVMHLSTRISGSLKTQDVDSLVLAQTLHPAPAVCGAPTGIAQSAINEIEQFNRGLYSGMVGWCDDGNGEWAVALRCAEVKDNTARLFAGAGIVAASCPEAELQETNIKLKTMLNVLGISDLNNAKERVI